MSRESVSQKEAARILDVSRWTVWRLIKDGKLKAFQVRRCKRIYLGEIQRFKRDQQIDVAGGCST